MFKLRSRIMTCLDLRAKAVIISFLTFSLTNFYLHFIITASLNDSVETKWDEARRGQTFNLILLPVLFHFTLLCFLQRFRFQAFQRFRLQVFFRSSATLAHRRTPLRTPHSAGRFSCTSCAASLSLCHCCVLLQDQSTQT